MYPLNMPLEECKTWLQGLVDIVKEGGIWGIPRTKSAYRVFKSRKTLALVQGPGDPATEYVIGRMGWKVEKEEGDGSSKV